MMEKQKDKAYNMLEKTEPNKNAEGQALVGSINKLVAAQAKYCKEKQRRRYGSKT
jgi:hypothetical protein